MSITDIHIIRVSKLLVLMCCVAKSSALLCYNCSSTHRIENQCGGEFAKSMKEFNNSRHYLLNCSGDNAMCFVRSWTARAKHAWIVQRGCYQTTSTDPFPRSMDTPTRAMTCKLERAQFESRVSMRFECREEYKGSERRQPLPSCDTYNKLARKYKMAEKLADAEYRVCLCQADWCNTTSQPKNPFKYLQIIKSFLYLLSINVLS